MEYTTPESPPASPASEQQTAVTEIHIQYQGLHNEPDRLKLLPPLMNYFAYGLIVLDICCHALSGISWTICAFVYIKHLLQYVYVHAVCTHTVAQ